MIFFKQNTKEDIENIDNIGNYAFIANNDYLRNGRRIMYAELSKQRKDDDKYFGLLRKRCFNDRVGKALYNYLLEINTTGFIGSRSQMPTTTTKAIAEQCQLNTTCNFLKHEYVLKKKDIKLSPKKLYAQYETFTHKNENKPMQFYKFCESLSNINLEPRKAGGNKNIYDIQLT